MARVRAGIVIRLVTACTGVWRIGIIAVVARVAIVCNRNMRTGERVKITVVKRRRHPRAFTVTGCTIRWKLGSNVVRISCCIVIGLMTPGTGIGRIGVVAVVAGCTIVRNRSMRPI